MLLVDYSTDYDEGHHDDHKPDRPRDQHNTFFFIPLAPIPYVYGAYSEAVDRTRPRQNEDQPCDNDRTRRQAVVLRCDR